MNFLCGAVEKPAPIRYGLEMRFHRLVIPVFMLFLAGCGTPSSPSDGGLLTPMPDEMVQEPDDGAVRVAVSAYLSQRGAPPSSLYDVHRVDLDGDKRREALVLFKNPYLYWCTGNGCPMIVLKANDDDFDFVNAIEPVRGPIYISTETHNGWRDIMMRVSGRWTQTKDVALAYNGSSYPESPEDLPSYDRLAQNIVSKIFR